MSGLKFQTNVSSEEQWQEEILGIKGQVQVVELYQKWSGPVKCIVSTLSSIYFELDKTPLKFYTACVDDIESLAKFVGHCEPVFLFFQDGQQIYRIDGVSTQKIRDEIDRISLLYGEEEPAEKPHVMHQKSMPSAAAAM